MRQRNLSVFIKLAKTLTPLCRTAIITGCFLSLLFGSGCSVINPHVSWERPPAGNSLQDGIDYANKAKEKYKEAIGEQAKFTSLLGIILIPLGAAALGMGIAQANGTSTAALGLAGAAGLGVGTWLSSKPRQLAYASGIKAMGCAVDAMLPLNFTDPEREGLKGALSDLDDKIGTVEHEVSHTKTLIEKVKRLAQDETELRADANKSVEVVEMMLTTAKTTWSAGTQLDQELSRAGQVLISAVDRIGAEVDAAIIKTESDVSALPAIINGLSQTSAQFKKPAEATTGPGKMSGKNPKTNEKATAYIKDDQTKDKGGAIKELNDELEVLKQKAQDLSTAIRKVAAIVGKVVEAKPLATLKQCGVDPAITGISVQPSALQFQKGKEETKMLVISGGKPPYAAQLLEDQNELKVKQTVPFGPIVEIRAFANVPVGSYQVYIADSAGNNEKVRVEVVEKQ